MRTSAGRRWIAACGAVLVLVGCAVVVTALIVDDDDGAGPVASTERAPADEEANRPETLADLLRDPSALPGAKVSLRDLEMTRPISDHVAVVDGAALLVARRPLPAARDGAVDVEGRAIVLPTRQLLSDIRGAAPAGLLDLAGVDLDTIGDVQVLVVADTVRPSSGG